MDAIHSQSMEDKALLEQHLRTAIRHFVELMYDFSETLFNRSVDNNSWSAAQLASHIAKSMDFVHQVLIAKTSRVQRDPKANEGELRTQMENMDVKTQAAAVLWPSDTLPGRTVLRKELTGKLQNLITDIKKLDIYLLCEDLAFPATGCLTRYELIAFSIFHIERHTKQLAAVRDLLRATNTLIERT